MFKKFVGLAIVLGVLCVASPDAQAGKGGSSGPKFSGGSSSPKSSPAPVSQPKFSGGSSPAPKASGGSSPDQPKFSGGSSGNNAVNKGSPTDKPRFSGGSTGPPAKIVTTSPIEGRTPTSVSKKPAGESFDKLSGTEARKTESRKAYQPAPAPASTYTTPAGKTVPIARDKSSDYLRGRLDESHWQTRYQRSDGFYGSYYSRYPIGGPGFVYYNDFYHPHWNFWLLSQSMDVMSMWVYHHQLSMDQARLNSMYAQNTELRARVAAMERQGIPRDVTYTPRNVDPDIMYNDNYVNAVYNPQPKMVDNYEYEDAPVHHGSGIGHVLLWIFVYVPLMCVGLFCLYWLVFCKKW